MTLLGVPLAKIIVSVIIGNMVLGIVVLLLHGFGPKQDDWDIF